MNKKQHYKQTISSYVKSLRLSEGLSLNAFAKKHNISRMLAKKYESKIYDKSPSAVVVSHFCKTFNISYNAFVKNFYLKKDEIKKTLKNIEILDEIKKQSQFDIKQLEILNTFDNLPEEVSANLVALLEAFIYVRIKDLPNIDVYYKLYDFFKERSHK